ncbi:hypothetical protein QYE76_042775 [Lolium multiflorum]|uniref:Uncharacterized protein n=2 Tax=Lolium TaxID=4520 RepID=A0AAD8THF4_LOLMU|nr:hypothetical protein QYE76_042775 [Lolium multiflorum]
MYMYVPTYPSPTKSPRPPLLSLSRPTASGLRRSQGPLLLPTPRSGNDPGGVGLSTPRPPPPTAFPLQLISRSSDSRVRHARGGLLRRSEGVSTGSAESAAAHPVRRSGEEEETSLLAMGLITGSFKFLMGMGCGVYVAQNYNVPNVKKLFNTYVFLAKHLEETYRKPKKDDDGHTP